MCQRRKSNDTQYIFPKLLNAPLFSIFLLHTILSYHYLFIIPPLRQDNMSSFKMSAHAHSHFIFRSEMFRNYENDFTTASTGSHIDMVLRKRERQVSLSMSAVIEGKGMNQQIQLTTIKRSFFGILLSFV